jgi:hypothetical protein
MVSARTSIESVTYESVQPPLSPFVRGISVVNRWLEGSGLRINVTLVEAHSEQSPAVGAATELDETAIFPHRLGARAKALKRFGTAFARF